MRGWRGGFIANPPYLILGYRYYRYYHVPLPLRTFLIFTFLGEGGSLAPPPRRNFDHGLVDMDVGIHFTYCMHISFFFNILTNIIFERRQSNSLLLY